MADALFDANAVASALAALSDGSGVNPLWVDPVTGRLKIHIERQTATTPVTVQIPLPRDANSVAVCGGATDDAAEDVHPLAIDSRLGLPYLDVYVE
jgi:hypothetical protein